MQYCSRIKVLVENLNDWNALKNIKFKDYGLLCTYKDFKKSKEFYIDMEWSIVEGDLRSLVREISDALEGKCVIVADTNNINIDPYKYCVYYFGNWTKTFYVPETHWKKVEKIDFCDIRNIAEWINVTKIKVSDKEKEYLKKFSVEFDEKSKKYIDKLLEERRKKEEEKKLKEEQEEKIAEEAYLKRENDIDRFYFWLAGTQYENRNDRIENLKISDEVKLLREPENPYDSNAILVVNEEGSLGHISSESAKEISPLIDNNLLKIKKAIVHEVVPLSKFVGTKKKGGDVCIAVEYELDENTKEFILEKIKKDKNYSDDDLWSTPLKIMKKCGILDDKKYKKIKNLNFKKSENGDGWKIFGIPETQDFKNIPSEILEIPVIEITCTIISLYCNKKTLKKMDYSVIIPEGIKVISDFPQNYYLHIKKICIPKSVEKIILTNRELNEYGREYLKYWEYHFVIEINENSDVEEYLKKEKCKDGINKFLVINSNQKEKYESIRNIGATKDEAGDLIAVIHYDEYFKNYMSKIVIPECLGDNIVKEIRFERWLEEIDELYISKNVERISSEFTAVTVNNVIISAENQYLSTDGFAIYNKNKTILYKYLRNSVEVEEYVVPDTVKVIKKCAFSYANSLKNLILPEGIEEIEYDEYDNTFSSSIKIQGIDLKKFGLK